MPSFFSRMLSSSGSSKRKQSREEQQAQAAEAFLAQGDSPSPSSSSKSQPQPAPTSGSSRPVPIPKPSGHSAKGSQDSRLPSSSDARSQSTSESVDTSDMHLEEHTAQYGSSPHRAPHKSATSKANQLAQSEEAASATEGDEASINDSNGNDDDLDVSELASSLPQPETRNGQPALPTTQAILANPSPSGAATQQQAQRSLQSGGSDARAFDLDNMIARLLAVGYSGKASKSPPLKTQEITAICQAAREVFMAQPAFLELSAPVKIVGDIHGQYSDLIRLFEMTGYPPQANFLFLGDYVDRGKQSLETILLLLCYKIKYPMNFFMLRGNHESASVTRVYGFYDECKRRTSLKVWKTFVDVFNCLPIAATIANKIFCVHGGLSPSLTDLDNIRKIQRPTDVPDFGLLNDLLWSDPSDTAIDWEDNERGVSYCFGKSVLQHFLAKYDLDLLCRAHMVVEDGYEFWNQRQLLTIFSAPNYCGEFDNFGAVMAVNDDLLCSFELLKPLDGQALKKELVRMRRRHATSSS